MSEYYETTADKFVFKAKKGLLYSRDEVWVKREADGSIRVGLTDFAQRRAGDLVFAEARPVGTKVTSGRFHRQLRDSEDGAGHTEPNRRRDS